MSTTISPLAVVQATGVAAVDLFLRTYADFVALFDSEELAKALQDELAIVGVSENTKQSMTIENFFKDIERLCFDLLERGALRRIQRFGITPEAQAQIERLENSARGIPRGATGGKRNSYQSADAPQESVSKWANFTNDQYNRMSATEVRNLRRTDPDFVAAVARLADEDTAKGLVGGATGRVYLKRSDGLYFELFRNQQPVFTSIFDSRAHMVYSEAHRLLTMFSGRGVQCQAYEMGNNALTDVSPRTVVPAEVPEKIWRFEPTGIMTVGQNQRKHRPGTFILKGNNGEFVFSIDDVAAVVKTCTQPGNARAWTSRETAIAQAESIPLPFQLYRHDGLLDTATHSGS